MSRQTRAAEDWSRHVRESVRAAGSGHQGRRRGSDGGLHTVLTAGNREPNPNQIGSEIRVSDRASQNIGSRTAGIEHGSDAHPDRIPVLDRQRNGSGAVGPFDRNDECHRGGSGVPAAVPGPRLGSGSRNGEALPQLRERSAHVFRAVRDRIAPASWGRTAPFCSNSFVPNGHVGNKTVGIKCEQQRPPTFSRQRPTSQTTALVR